MCFVRGSRERESTGGQAKAKQWEGAERRDGRVKGEEGGERRRRRERRAAVPAPREWPTMTTEKPWGTRGGGERRRRRNEMVKG